MAEVYVKVRKGLITKKVPKRLLSDYVAAGWVEVKETVFNTTTFK